MRTADVQSLVERVTAVDASCTDSVVLKAGVADLRVLKSWVEGREVMFAQALAKVSSFPEKSLAEAGNMSVRHGGQLLQRAETVAAVPAFGVSLDEGRLAGERIDVLVRRDGWKPTAMAWNGWRVSDALCGLRRGLTKRPGWAAGR